MPPTISSSRPLITWFRWPSSGAVETPQHQRLTDVAGADAAGALEARYRAREPQQPCPPAPRESALAHRFLKQAPASLVYHAPALHLGVAQARVAACLALELHAARPGHALGGHAGAVAACGRRLELGRRDARHFHVHV